MAYKIVVADDSKTTHKVAELALKGKEFEVFFVSNGNEAIDKINEVKPDLVLLDIDLPQTNGYQICRYINENLKDISVVLLKGAFETIDRTLIEDLVYEDIISKPFDVAQLTTKVREIFEKRNYKEKEEEKEEIMVNPFIESAEKKTIGLPEEMETETLEKPQITISEELVSEISEKIIRKISPEIIKEAVERIVPQIAEELIKKEIEKIKKEVESISSS
ncbi:response regulator [Candidatus Aminicenantes bacterium AC-335-A11]|jgi:DNA-binding response OmpR family regulator|nr:response regulator [Candidatus Aminicenantes bacterium AC-335-A11]